MHCETLQISYKMKWCLTICMSSRVYLTMQSSSWSHTELKVGFLLNSLNWKRFERNICYAIWSTIPPLAWKHKETSAMTVDVLAEIQNGRLLNNSLTHVHPGFEPFQISCSCSGTQKCPNILRHPKVHYSSHKSPPSTPPHPADLCLQLHIVPHSGYNPCPSHPSESIILIILEEWDLWGSTLSSSPASVTSSPFTTLTVCVPDWLTDWLTDWLHGVEIFSRDHQLCSHSTTSQHSV
jgi:hypothetical protein